MKLKRSPVKGNSLRKNYSLEEVCAAVGMTSREITQLVYPDLSERRTALEVADAILDKGEGDFKTFCFALRLQEEHLGSASPKLAWAMTRIADALAFGKAKAWYDRALALANEEDYPSHAQILSWYGSRLLEEKAWMEAKQAFSSSIAEFERAGKTDDPSYRDACLCLNKLKPEASVGGEKASGTIMKQYKAAKVRYPRHLLFYRIGDFFELFHDDAKTASRILDLALTSRKNGAEAIPMAGVPCGSVEQYVARLLRMGYSVAICDQTSCNGTAG